MIPSCHDTQNQPYEEQLVDLARKDAAPTKSVPSFLLTARKHRVIIIIHQCDYQSGLNIVNIAKTTVRK